MGSETMEPNISANYVSFLGPHGVAGIDGDSTSTDYHFTSTSISPTTASRGNRSAVAGSEAANIRKYQRLHGSREDGWKRLLFLLAVAGFGFVCFSLLLLRRNPAVEGSWTKLYSTFVSGGGAGGLARNVQSGRIRGPEGGKPEGSDILTFNGVPVEKEMFRATANERDPSANGGVSAVRRNSTAGIVPHTNTLHGDDGVGYVIDGSGHGGLANGGNSNGNLPILRPPLIWMWQETDFLEEFEAFVNLYGKAYRHEDERRMRYQIYKKNVYFVHTHNELGLKYSVRMNKFGDLTLDEFKAQFVGYRKNPRSAYRSLGVDVDLLNVNEEDLPNSVDWTAKGCVTEIKDQKSCGSCWAFSTTGSIEGTTCAQTGRLVDLSEQQLVDCAQPEGNFGCDGGQMDAGFQYVIDNHGLCGEHAYPYTAVQGDCMAKNCTNVVTVKGFKDVPHNSELALRNALNSRGPVAVAIEADHPGFQFYSKGVFGGSCGDSLDHGVLVVGYGTDQTTGLDYWVVKNSWGPDWGEHGFVQLARHKGKEGECGILLEASYPIVV